MPNGMRNRRNRSRRTPVQSQMRLQKRQHHLDFTGIVGRGRSDPSRVSLNPWNSITLSTLVVGTSTPSNKCISFVDLDSFFTAQTSLSAGQLYRVQSAQVWHIIPNGELNNRVRVRFYSLVGTSTSCDIVKVLSNVEDYGTPARNATAKFIWPLTHSSNVFASTNTNVVLRLTLEASQQVLLHIRVLWKPLGASSTVLRCNPQDNSWVLTRDEVSNLHNSPLFAISDDKNEENSESISSSLSRLDLDAT